MKTSTIVLLVLLAIVVAILAFFAMRKPGTSFSNITNVTQPARNVWGLADTAIRTLIPTLMPSRGGNITPQLPQNQNSSQGQPARG